MAPVGTFIKNNWLRIYLVLFAAGLVFAYGVAVGMFKLFPYRALQAAAGAALEWARHPKHYARLEPQLFLAPAREPGAGVVRHVLAATLPGQTFLTGFFKDRPGLRLIDMDGHTLH